MAIALSLTTTSPGRCANDREYLDNPVQRFLRKHGLLVFITVSLLVTAALVIEDANDPPGKTWCEENPTSSLCVGGNVYIPSNFYEEEFGSHGPGDYYYGFPNWGECVQSGGYVVNQGTSGDDPVTCRFHYSGP